MRPAGLDPAAAQPVYGLAEATLAVTFPPPGEVAEPLVLDRAALGRGLAVDTVAGAGALELMDVGLPVAGCAVRIVDDGGAELGDRRVGHILVRGPNWPVVTTAFRGRARRCSPTGGCAPATSGSCGRGGCV